MKKNKKPIDRRMDTDIRTAGGKGIHAAKQTPEALLRRSVMTCLLWEDPAYEKGSQVADNIRSLVHQVSMEAASEIAIEARNVQKLRHVPLLVVREMARHPDLKRVPGLVSDTLANVIQRADEIAEFLSLYWMDGRQPLSAQVKKGLAKAFERFGEYHFAKYNRDETVKLRDALFLSHAKPASAEREDLYKRLVEGQLQPPDTWEVQLSAGADKRATFERLIGENKLGALAFLRNLRGMVEAGVPDRIIREGFQNISPRWLLPVNYLAAAKYAPRFEPEIEELMLSGFQQVAKLPGRTIFIVDVSGSMGSTISDKSEFNRMDVACAMAMVAEATCEQVAIYATAGNDGTKKHATRLVMQHDGILRGSGFRVIEAIKAACSMLGGGGIFTRQCLEYIKEQERGQRVDRIIVFSDSQDCDFPQKRVPEPFGYANYIVDVSAHGHGVNYDGVWTAEISGWSDHFIDYIAALEGMDWTQQGDTEIAGLLEV